MLIENCDYFVRVIDFPVGARSDGMLVLNSDGTYSVYINARASKEAQKKAMRHELQHMTNNDMYENDILSAENL